MRSLSAATSAWLANPTSCSGTPANCFSVQVPSSLALCIATAPAPPPELRSAPRKTSGRFSIAMRDTKEPRELPVVSVRVGVAPHLAMKRARTSSRSSTACASRYDTGSREMPPIA